MAQQLELSVSRRETTGKSAAKSLRAQGQLPAVLYGHGEEPIKFAVGEKLFSDLLRQHGTRHMLVLTGDGGGETAFIKELQRHPVRGEVTTIDFIRVSRNERITISVPLVTVGEQADLQSGDGVLAQALHEVQLSATPANIPDRVEADISGLELGGAAMTLGQIALPDGVELISDPDLAVAAINPTALEETTEEVAPEGEEATEEAAEDVPSEEGDGPDSETSDES